MERKLSPSTDKTIQQRHRLQSHTPGTNTRDLANNYKQMVTELAPKTPLETSIVHDIACNDADLTMMRARRNMILWQKAITPMFGMLRKTVDLDDAAARELAKDWATGLPQAEGRIRTLGIDPEFAHNQAFIENFLLIDAIDKQIERLERRRRQLLDDYRRMKPVPEHRLRSSEQIADAELVAEGSDDT